MSDRPRLGLTRRDALIIGAAGAGAALFELGRIHDRYIPPDIEARNIAPFAYDFNPYLVREGANLRTSPKIPNSTMLHHPDNRIRWDEIDSVMEVSLNGAKSFVIAGHGVVAGQATDHDYYFDEQSGTEWIKLEIRTKKGQRMPVYANKSFQTREVVTPLLDSYYFSSPEQDSAELKQFFGHRTFIFVPNSPETAARQFVPTIWAGINRQKLDGQIPLRGRYEEKVQNAKVVSGGDSWAEKMAMEMAGTPVNLREYDARQYRTNEPVGIVGKVQLNTILKTALSLRSGYLAVRIRDIDGPIQELQTPREKLEAADTVVAISNLYISFP